MRIFIICCILFFTHTTLFCWGFKAHKQINKKSILFLPTELASFYKLNNIFYIEHSADPDKRKRFIKDEKFKHYINADIYEPYPFTEVPKFYKKAVEKYGADEVKKNGLLPWNIEWVFSSLTQAFKNKDADKVLKLSSDLGHYVGDASVPLHVTKNYNGQLSNQEGIHSLWETESVRLMDLDTMYMDYHPVVYIDKINTAAWNLILHSYTFVDIILKSEKELSHNFTEAEKYKIQIKKGVLKKSYSKEFIKQFLQLNKYIIKNRIQEGSYFLACLIYTAWVDAGQPDVKKLVPKKFKTYDTNDVNEDDIEH